MIKLLWWLNYGEIIKWERVGILECHRNLWCIFEFSVGFAAVFFLMNGYIMMLSLECCRNHWKVVKVFLNVQNKRTDNFDLLKSLTNTCKQLYFFTKKMNAHKDLFQNITYCISKILLSSNNTYLKGYLSKFLCK